MKFIFILLIFLSSCIPFTKKPNFSSVDRYLNEGKTELALEKLKVLEEKRKKDLSLKLKLAEIYYRLEIYEEAKKRYLEILNKKELSLCLLRLSYIFENEYLYDEAIDYLKRYLKKEENLDESFRLVGLLEKTSKYNEAISLLKSIQNKIDEEDYTEKLFWLYIKKGEKEKALEFIKDKDNSLLKGFAFLLVKNYKEAKKYLSKSDSEISRFLLLLIDYLEGKNKEKFLNKILIQLKN